MRTLGPLIILASALAVGACAQTRAVKTNIYEDRRTGVALRRVVGGDAVPFARGYSHPASFAIEDLKYILRAIGYQNKGLFGWSDVHTVFTASEIYRLTPHLVEALAKATPDDEVVFHVTSAKRSGIFSSECFTNGRLFVNKNKLNCIFANVNVKPITGETYDGDPRNYYSGIMWRLTIKDWQNLVKGEKGTHYNWIELDFERGIEEKKQKERAIREKAARRRALKKKRRREKIGWEDWVPDEAVEQENDDETIPPPPESP